MALHCCSPFLVHSQFRGLKGQWNHLLCSAVLLRATGQKLQMVYRLNLRRLGILKSSWDRGIFPCGDISALVYLWNPFTILSCVGFSTSPIENLAVIVSLYGAVTRHMVSFSVSKICHLSPNIGVFWYFFAEVFDFSRNYLLIVFQIYIFLSMLLPLARRFKHRPCFIAFVYLAFFSILKSYPSVGDAALYLSLWALFVNELTALVLNLLWIYWIFASQPCDAQPLDMEGNRKRKFLLRKCNGLRVLSVYVCGGKCKGNAQA